MANKLGFREIETIKVDIRNEYRSDGTVLLRSAVELLPHAFQLTERLKHWSSTAPERIFIAQKKNGVWETLTYKET